MTVQDIIKKKPLLAWSSKNPQTISDEAVLETVLNYGDWDDFRQFIKIKGLRQTVDMFSKALKRKRNNYRPEVKYYFKLYFQKHAPRNTD